MTTLKDLFSEKANYVVELPLNAEYHLFIEGLDEYGGTNTAREFNADNIKTLCVELIDSDGEYVETVDNIGVTLETDIERLKEIALNLGR